MRNKQPGFLPRFYLAALEKIGRKGWEDFARYGESTVVKGGTKTCAKFFQEVLGGKPTEMWLYNF